MRELARISCGDEGKTGLWRWTLEMPEYVAGRALFWRHEHRSLTSSFLLMRDSLGDGVHAGTAKARVMERMK